MIRPAPRPLPVALFLLLVIFFLATSFRGIDFGRHWDEKVTASHVHGAVALGTVNQGFYHYPTLYQELGVISLIPDIVRLAFTPPGETGRRERLLAKIRTYDVLFRFRGITVVLSTLALLWTFLAVWIRNRNDWAALIASAFMGLSWEIATHARWFTVDPILLHNAALTLLGVSLYDWNGRKRWLILSAVAAGLGAGSKYPGGLLILPVLISVLAREKQNSLRLRWIGLAVAAMITTFILTTPALIADTQRFIASVRDVAAIYAGSHEGYTISRGFPHVFAITRYLSTVFFSPVTALSLAASLLCLTGAIVLIRYDRTQAAVLLSFPLSLIFFFSLQSVFQVRNILPVTPFLAVFASNGALTVYQSLNNRIARAGVAGLLVAFFFVNGAWMAWAAETIHIRQELDPVRHFATHVEKHPETRFSVSERLAKKLSGDILTRAHVSRTLDKGTVAAFYLAEGDPAFIAGRWNAHGQRLFLRWFGSMEVNLNIYPSWLNDDKVMLATPEQARAMEIVFSQ